MKKLNNLKRRTIQFCLFAGLFFVVFFIANLPAFIIYFKGSADFSVPWQIKEHSLEKNANYLLINKINLQEQLLVPSLYDNESLRRALEEGVLLHPQFANIGKDSTGLIFGHSSDFWWNPGKAKYAFMFLEKLVPGDEIIVMLQGRSYKYSTKEISIVWPSAVKNRLEGGNKLLLVTCWPLGTSLQRLVVEAEFRE